MLKAVRALTVLLTLIALGTSAGQAQAPGADILTVNAYAGGYSPMSSLAADSEFGASGAVGGAATVWVHPLIGVRANVLYAQTEVSNGAPEPLAGENPDIWSYGGDLLLRLPRSARNGRDSWFPYIVGGLGGKTYRFDELDSETDFAGSFGAGAEYRFGRWGLQAEVRDVVSSFDRFGVDRTQHDIVWTAGLTVSF